MKKRLVVTGAGGFVGGSVVRQAGGFWELHAFSRKEVPFHCEGLRWHLFDLTDLNRLRAALDEVKPDAVIHAAAAADIDFCETHRDAAEAVNVGVAREIARFCRERGAKMALCSTDNVFDGRKGNYSEDDLAGPVNFYAGTKVRAEQAVAGELSNAVVARLSLVIGLPVLGAGNSFMSKMIAALEAGREAGLPDDEIRTPIDVITLGRALLELAENDFTGCMHLAGNDRLTRFDMGRRIAARMGYSADRVVVKNSSDIPGRAPRPPDISLNNARARAALKTPMLGLDEGIDLILARRAG